MNELIYIRLAAFLLLVSTLINIVLLLRLHLLRKFVKFTSVGTILLKARLNKLEEQHEHDSNKPTE